MLVWSFEPETATSCEDDSLEHGGLAARLVLVTSASILCASSGVVLSWPQYLLILVGRIFH